MPTELPDSTHWLTTGQVAKHVGASSDVVLSWIVKGIKNAPGLPNIFLRARKVKGGWWVIEPAAVADFIAATTVASLHAEMNVPPGSSLEEIDAAHERYTQTLLVDLTAHKLAREAANPDTPIRKRGRPKKNAN